jgi:hypothetical protein
MLSLSGNRSILKMPTYKLYSTHYIFKDATVEADSKEEAIAMGESDICDWITVGGDWAFHSDMTYKESD